MASAFAVVNDDNYKAYVNFELICMFRVKKDMEGKLTDEVEIEYIGGHKTRLVGETARAFLIAARNYGITA